MMGLLFLFDFFGYVALLLWGVHMVQSGVQRAFGARLGAALGRALGTRLRAFTTGLCITAALQSSTATGLMIAGFAAGGVVSLVPALAAMLGANVGTTLIVQVLSFNLTQLAPIFILIGVWIFRRQRPSRTRDLSRVFIGLGLLLMSLHQLVDLFAPLEHAHLLRIILEALESQPLAAVLVAAVLTWAAHSSVATVVLIMSLASHGIVSPGLAFAMVLGANLGTAINPIIEGVSGDDPSARRMPVGNLLTRVVGVVIGLATLPWVEPLISGWSQDPLHAVANFHTLFNIVIALVFLPLLKPYSNLLTRWMPKRVNPNDPGRPLYLDESARDVPTVALGNASREALRMTDLLQSLLAYVRSGFRRDIRPHQADAHEIDSAVDRLEAAITRYLATMDPDNLTGEDRARLDVILAFVSNIGHAVDLTYHSLMGQTSRMRKQGVMLTDALQSDLDQGINRLVANLKLAATILLTEDLRQARRLAGEKEWFRHVELESAEQQMQQVKAGNGDAAEAISLYLDILRDMKSINSHLVGAAAYPLLARHGELLPSRLRDNSD